jgi:hypothetical protein
LQRAGSEGNPASELDHSRRILLARCFAKRSYRKIVDIQVRLVKAYAVKGVEEIRPEIKARRFPNLKALDDGKVFIVERESS